jgi:hypothetical protein
MRSLNNHIVLESGIGLGKPRNDINDMGQIFAFQPPDIQAKLSVEVLEF